MEFLYKQVDLEFEITQIQQRMQQAMHAAKNENFSSNEDPRFKVQKGSLVTGGLSKSFLENFKIRHQVEQEKPVHGRLDALSLVGQEDSAEENEKSIESLSRDDFEEKGIYGVSNIPQLHLLNERRGFDGPSKKPVDFNAPMNISNMKKQSDLGNMVKKDTLTQDEQEHKFKRQT